jgi:hypothetical protein
MIPVIQNRKEVTAVAVVVVIVIVVIIITIIVVVHDDETTRVMMMVTIVTKWPKTGGIVCEKFNETVFEHTEYCSSL